MKTPPWKLHPMSLGRPTALHVARVLLMASLCGITPVAAAAPVVSFAFQGIVTDLIADAGLFGTPGSVLIGDPFSGHFSYDVGPGNPDQVADPEQGIYNVIDFVVDDALVPLSGALLSVQHRPPIGTFPPDPPDPGLDAFEIVAMAPGYSGVVLALTAPFGAVFSDDSLPQSLVLANFTDQRILNGIVTGGIDGGQGSFDAGELQSLTRVPEPNALFLLGMGLVAVATWVHRRKF
jgi:hypothetical protein